MRWVIVFLAVFVAGWFTFEGCRALIVGDYVTPKSGRFAGQLGPWAKVVSAVGIEPRSSLMKSLFLIYGILWLALTVCYILELPWAWWALLIAAVGALWYVPFGTLLSIIQIVLLLIRRS